MKILVLGDIHGRLIWSDIIGKEQPDLTVFLGDYVSTHEKISAEQQLSNLEDILNYKANNPDKTILLRGNHDLQHCGYYWAACSGLDRKVQANFPKDRFIAQTQWVYIHENLLFSHAGVSQVWLMNTENTVESINDMPVNENFAFWPEDRMDYCGSSKTQSPVWIRPWVLPSCKANGDWIQIVGHTTMPQCQTDPDDEDIWLCDALGSGSYLIIEDGKFEERKIKGEV